MASNSNFGVWQALIVGVVSAVLTFGAAVAATSTGYLNKNRELDIQMVNVSLSILRGDSKGTESEMARRFALRALGKYSGVEIPAEEFDAWVSGGTVPFKPTGWSSALASLYLYEGMSDEQCEALGQDAARAICRLQNAAPLGPNPPVPNNPSIP